MSFRGEQRGHRRQARRPELASAPGRVAAIASLLVVGVVVLMIVLDAGPDAHPHPVTVTPTAGSPHTSQRTGTSRTVVQPGSATVPILVYHVINAQPAGSSANSALYVPTDQFSSQMQTLKSQGWRAVTLNQLEAYWTRGTSLGPGKPIVITFDNGYASQYTNALPVLKGLGWVAVENLQLTGLSPSEGGLTGDQIHGLIAAGWELDTQGVEHTDLTALDPSQLSNDLTSARQMMQSQYGVTPNWFSYPSGDYNPTVAAAVQAAGYTGATTVNQGWANPKANRFLLPRLAVTAGTTPSQLLSQIAAAQANTAVPSAYSGVGLA
jgi:peptidoglycan/xylan/chitin deacetylase (PgdA/CDA1 family)